MKTVKEFYAKNKKVIWIVGGALVAGTAACVGIKKMRRPIGSNIQKFDTVGEVFEELKYLSYDDTIIESGGFTLITRHYTDMA